MDGPRESAEALTGVKARASVMPRTLAATRPPAARLLRLGDIQGPFRFSTGYFLRAATATKSRVEACRYRLAGRTWSAVSLTGAKAGLCR